MKNEIAFVKNEKFKKSKIPLEEIKNETFNKSKIQLLKRFNLEANSRGGVLAALPGSLVTFGCQY